MRRSTAAALGTLTGAALIMGVRFTVTPPEAPSAAADSSLDLGGDASPPAGGKGGGKAGGKDSGDAAGAGGDDSGSAGGAGGTGGGLKDGDFLGDPVKYQYGTLQVKIRVSDGKVTNAVAKYPTDANSAAINPPAVAKLKQQLLQAQSADLDTVSGATYTSAAYQKSLQAALDKAGA